MDNILEMSDVECIIYIDCNAPFNSSHFPKSLMETENMNILG